MELLTIFYAYFKILRNEMAPAYFVTIMLDIVVILFQSILLFWNINMHPMVIIQKTRRRIRRGTLQ